MKVQVLQENLSKALTVCSRFSSSRVQLPVLANVLLKTQKNKLIISATNLETSVSITVGAKVDSEGEVTVPSRTITDLVNQLRTGQINLTSEKEILKIESSGFKSTVSGMNASDFPAVPQDVGAGKNSLESKLLVDALSHTLFSVSVDETRPVLTGVLLILSKAELVFVSTDGFRLSQKKIKVKETKNESKVIIPKNALSELARLSSEEDIVDFSFNTKDNQIIFAIGGSILSSRIIDGEFPDFERIIPKKSEIKVNLDKEELIRAVKLASVFARDSANVIKMKLGKDKIAISAESQQSGSQTTQVDAKVDDKESTGKGEFEIAFNYRFLEEFLGVASGEDVEIELSDPNAPALFLDPKDNDYLHIIMPVRIQA